MFIKYINYKYNKVHIEQKKRKVFRTFPQGLITFFILLNGNADNSP